MGESSVVMVKRPSKGLSGRGEVTWAEIWVCILGWVLVMSQDSEMGIDSAKCRQNPEKDEDKMVD
jgi:hypothetical protein